MKRSMVLGAAWTLAGCAALVVMPGEESDSGLCERASYFLTRAEPELKGAFLKEVQKRNLLTGSLDEELIEQGKVAVGMSECALIATMGWPSRTNKSVNAWGAREQWVYDGGIRTWYFYLENEKVTSYSKH